MTTGHPSRLMMITIHYRVHGWPEVTRRDVRMEPCRGVIKEKTSTYLAGEGGREICPSTWARFMLSSQSSPLKSEFLGRCLLETWWTGFFELFILHFGTRNSHRNLWFMLVAPLPYLAFISCSLWHRLAIIQLWESNLLITITNWLKSLGEKKDPRTTFFKL